MYELRCLSLVNRLSLLASSAHLLDSKLVVYQEEMAHSEKYQMEAVSTMQVHPLSNGMPTNGEGLQSPVNFGHQCIQQVSARISPCQMFPADIQQTLWRLCLRTAGLENC